MKKRKYKFAIRSGKDIILCIARPVFLKWSEGVRVNRWHVKDGNNMALPEEMLGSGQCKYASEKPELEKQIKGALYNRVMGKAIADLGEGVA